MKKKSLATLLSGFLTVCLTGVGFASWIIVQGATDQVSSGSLVVESVQDRRLTMTTEFIDDTVKFGPTGPQTEGWLITTTSVTAVEDLTFSIKVTINNSDHLDHLEVGITNAAYTTAAGNNLVTELPTISHLTNDSGTIDAADDKKVSTYSVSTAYTAGTLDTDGVTVKTVGQTVFTITVNLNWGSHFGNLNPYEHYKKITSPKESDITDAKTSLAGVYALNSQKFEISLNAVASRT